MSKNTQGSVNQLEPDLGPSWAIDDHNIDAWNEGFNKGLKYEQRRGTYQSSFREGCRFGYADAEKAADEDLEVELHNRMQRVAMDNAVLETTLRKKIEKLEAQVGQLKKIINPNFTRRVRVKSNANVRKLK